MQNEIVIEDSTFIVTKTGRSQFLISLAPNQNLSKSQQRELVEKRTQEDINIAKVSSKVSYEIEEQDDSFLVTVKLKETNEII